jgi:hypothetical protein
MSLFGFLSPPKPPDPYKTAGSQLKTNIAAGQAANIMNNPNETNPYGSVSYNATGSQTIIGADGKPVQVPTYSRNVAFSPEQQGLYNTQTQTQQAVGNMGLSQAQALQGTLSQPMTTAGLQAWNAGTAPTSLQRSYIDTGSSPETAFTANSRAVQDAMMGRWAEQNNPAQASQEAQMIARGLAPGSQGYGQMQDAQSRARTDAEFAAQLAGGQEQSRLLDEARQAATFSNNAQQQDWQNAQGYADFQNKLRDSQFGETSALRNQNINELSAMMGASAPTTPEFAQAYRQGVTAPDLTSDVYNTYGIQAQNKANMTKGLFGLAGSILTAPMTGGTSLAGMVGSKLFG